MDLSYDFSHSSVKSDYDSISKDKEVHFDGADKGFM